MLSISNLSRTSNHLKINLKWHLFLNQTGLVLSFFLHSPQKSLITFQDEEVKLITTLNIHKHN